MSAVLGPIHEWMYNKVIIQEKIISAIVELADDKGWQHAILGKADFPSLEEVIDLSNIHGSLFGMIDETETRYAKLVSELMKEDVERSYDIEKMVTFCGVSIALQPQTSAVNTYQQFEGYLLDGKRVINGLSVLRPEYLILFKSKAYLDLWSRRQAGESVQSSEYKKHKKDILRIAVEMELERPSTLPAAVRSDIRSFIDSLETEPFDVNTLINYQVSTEEIAEILRELFL